MTTVAKTTAGTAAGRRRSRLLLGLIAIGFVSLGLPDSILGVAWSAMRVELHQPVDRAGVVTLALTLCSAIASFASGAILRRLGTARLLMICGFVTGLALLGFGLAPAFWCLIALALPLGFGQGAVDTGMNYYVAKHYSSRAMSWLHASWGIGASGGPLLTTALLAAGRSWRWSYIAIAAVQVSLAVLFLLTRALWNDPGHPGRGGRANTATGFGTADRPRRDARFWCCTGMFALFTGLEAGTALWGHTFLTTCRGIDSRTAGFAIAGYWGMLTLGRFLMGFIANRLGNQRQILGSILLALASSVLLAMPLPPALTLAAIGLLGLAAAPFYPAMMHAAPERFDDVTAATLIGYQGGAGMLGVMTLPPAFGFLAARTSFALLPWMAMLLATGVLLAQLRVDGLPRRHGPAETGASAT